MTTEPTPATDAALEKLWLHVLNRWEDDAAHVAFLENCRETGSLAQAATRYRGLAGNATYRERADRQLSAITALALAQLEAGRTPQPRRGPTSPRVALVLTLVLAVALFVLYFSVLD